MAIVSPVNHEVDDLAHTVRFLQMRIFNFNWDYIDPYSSPQNTDQGSQPRLHNQGMFLANKKCILINIL